MAAVLAYGPDALLSHRAAAALWGVWMSAGKTDVTTSGATRNRPGTRAHRSELHPEDRATRDGIPVTSVARTIMDLSGTLDTEDRLTKLIENADRRELFDLRALERAIARRPGWAGATRLRAVMAAYRDPEDTRSDLERDFLALIRRAELPRPQVNVLVAGELVDVFWPEWKLVTELDSRTYHSSPRAFERDRIRDAILQRNGYRVLRITRKRLHRAPQAVLADVQALLRPPRA